MYFDGVLKLLGVSHGLFGGLLIVLGIVVRIVVDHWTSVMLLALWIGVVVSAVSSLLESGFCFTIGHVSIDIPTDHC